MSILGVWEGHKGALGGGLQNNLEKKIKQLQYVFKAVMGNVCTYNIIKICFHK